MLLLCFALTCNLLNVVAVPVDKIKQIVLGAQGGCFSNFLVQPFEPWLQFSIVVQQQQQRRLTVLGPKGNKVYGFAAEDVQYLALW